MVVRAAAQVHPHCPVSAPSGGGVCRSCGNSCSDARLRDHFTTTLPCRPLPLPPQGAGAHLPAGGGGAGECHICAEAGQDDLRDLHDLLAASAPSLGCAGASLSSAQACTETRCPPAAFSSLPLLTPFDPSTCCPSPQFALLYYFGGWPGLVWAGAVRQVLMWHVTWLVNR